METRKPVLIKEGGKYAFYMRKINGEIGLCVGNIFSCRDCGTLTATNAPWLLSRPSEKVYNQANILLKEYGPIGRANGDSEGNTYCEDCYIISEKISEEVNFNEADYEGYLERKEEKYKGRV